MGFRALATYLQDDHMTIVCALITLARALGKKMVAGDNIGRYRYSTADPK